MSDDNASMAPSGDFNTVNYLTTNTAIGGGGLIQQSPGYTITTTPNYGYTFESCPGGHIAADDWVELPLEGLWQNKCMVCGAVFRATVPDSVNMTEVKELLGEIMGLDEGVDLDGFDVSDALGRYTALKEKIEAKAYELRQIERLILLAGKMLEKKVSD